MVFGIVGAALGIRPQSNNRATSFGLCVAIVFLYYLLGFLMGSFGAIELLSPFLAAWLPNFMGLGVGILLLQRFSVE